MNTIGGDVLQAINKAIDLAEKEYQGLVGNQGKFSVGANIGMIFMMAVEQEYDELKHGYQNLQDTMMRTLLFYSSCSTAWNDFGGGCEMSLHADKVVRSRNLYGIG
jgi:3-hydroxyacyl-CoA dehydrogenase